MVYEDILTLTVKTLLPVFATFFLTINQCENRHRARGLA